MKGAFSGGHELTLATAKEILVNGGNAFDAAIASFCSMFITEPCMASAGANGFAMIYQDGKGFEMLDFFSQTPISKNLNQDLHYYPIEVNFGNETEIFNVGLAAAAVPGAIAFIFKLHELYGSIPIKDLIQPACNYAKEGVILNAFQAYDLHLLAEIFKQDLSVEDIFFKNGAIKKEGDKIKMPEMADFLEFISYEGRRGFYEGEIAKMIAEDAKRLGGFLTREDFEKYKVNFIHPVSIPLDRRHTLQTCNSPSKGGLGLGLFFGHLLNENQDVPTAIKSSQNKLEDLNQAQITLENFYPNNGLKSVINSNAFKGTSHFNILDKWGNAISLTCSLGEGCGYFIPGTAMHLNNMLGETFLLPNGNHSWIPSTRLNSMMTPSMIKDIESNKLKYLTGSGGASRIPFAIGQVINNVLFKKMSLHTATDAPRCHIMNDILHFEKGCEINQVHHNIHEWEEQSLFFGGVHSILIDSDITAAADERRIGAAEVF